MRANLYESVTQTIITQMEAGVIPWSCPWKTAKGVAYIPTNVASGRRYNGVNVLILWAAAMERGYPSHGWMTFHQAKQIGAHVRKGERGTQILFIAHKEVQEDGETRLVTMPKAHTVFHAEQLENLPETYQAKEEPPPKETAYQEALRLITESRVPFEYRHPHAAYNRSRDVVEMPPHSSFESEDEFYGVALHELIHAVGAEHRLNRDLSGRFKSKAYGHEELIAELGSAFLCAHAGIPARHRSPAYVKNWISALKEDSRAIFTAASMASKSADWVLEQGYAVHEDTPDIERQVHEQTAVAV